MKKVFSLLAIAAISVASFAEDIDLGKSSLVWKATKKIGGGHTGTIKLKSAKIELAGKKLKKGEFVVDMNSLQPTDLEGEWKQKFETHVKSEDFFEVAKFPTATLAINKHDGKSVVEGKLTIKDKTHPVKIKYNQKDKSYKGTLKFDRTKFGIIYGSKNFFKNLAGDKIINNEVELEFNIVLK